MWKASYVDTLRFAFVALIVAAWGTLASMAVIATQDTRAQLSDVAVATSKGFSEYVGLHIAYIDHLLLQFRSNYLAGKPLPPEAEIEKSFSEMAPILLQISIADRTGLMVQSTLPLPPGISIGDRPHFRTFVEDPSDRLYVSSPVVGRVSKKMSIQLVRPILKNGEFVGAIVASINPLTLQQYFSSLPPLLPGSTVAIVGRQDGKVLARFSRNEITWGQSVRQSPLWRELSTKRSGLLQSRSVIDSKNRILGFHQVAAYPMYVAVGAEYDRWIVLRDLRFWMVTGVMIGLTAALYALHRLLRRRESDQQKLITQLRLSREREAEANRMKSNFIASVSHELRTPLNSILGFSDLIREQANNEQLRRFGDLIYQSGSHLHALVNTLLDLAKIEAGRMDVQREDVDVGSMLATLVEVHRVSAVKKRLDMRFNLSLREGEAIILSTDRTKLAQVVNNVLHNAVKFTETGSVTVDADLRGGTFHIGVADTGVGIAEADLSRVFDRFETVAQDPAAGGSGLGLALSRDLIHLMGGTISLTSKVGVGTRVEIMLPDARLQGPS